MSARKRPRKPETVLRDLYMAMEMADGSGAVVEDKDVRRFLAELRRSLKAAAAPPGGQGEPR